MSDRTLASIGQRVRSVVAVKVQASVFDRMVGHFVTGHMVGASSPADVAA